MSSRVAHGVRPPIARGFGGVHDLYIRNHRYTRLRYRLANTAAHLHLNGPWKSRVSPRYDESAVTTGIENMTQARPLAIALGVSPSHMN